MKTAKLAIMYDFDKTLSPKDMQEFSFIPSLGIEPAQFWSEVTALSESQKMDGILTDEEMSQLNYRVENDNEDEKTVAVDFLTQKGLL